MEPIPGITLVPVLHGRAHFSSHIRQLSNDRQFSCVAVDIPIPFCDDLLQAVDELPIISAITATQPTADATVYYVPTDPSDAMIEALRQARQKRLPAFCIGQPALYTPPSLPPLPDEYAINSLGFDAYTSLCLRSLHAHPSDPTNDHAGQFIASRLLDLRGHYDTILACVHFRHIVSTIRHLSREQTYNLTFPAAPTYAISTFLINPDHLYFALGELPFVTGRREKERQDVFAAPVPFMEIFKDLFCATRDDYYDANEATPVLSPVRIQNGLTFLRNLTIQDDRFIPSLFDIVATAKGIGGNSFAVRILKSAKYYPYLPVELDEPLMSVGINKVKLPESETPQPAVNLFHDTTLVWKTLAIKPDPSEFRKKKYQYLWDPRGMCSHTPEDRLIENFNTHVRTKALKVLFEDQVRTEKFQTSALDGIDIRETLRNWHTGSIYVKEIPPSRGTVDTVVIIFDDEHDERYPHRSTWYAEHNEESTLTFYASDPFADMIGPGIARCTYGGVSLLFPPRQVPSVFELNTSPEMYKLSYQLTYGGLLFSRERSIAYVAAKKPDLYLKRLAAQLKKHLIWVPLSSFSAETLRKLRRFHILNGKEVRSWAARFIGE